jgi:hypothetical protein
MKLLQGVVQVHAVAKTVINVLIKRKYSNVQSQLDFLTVIVCQMCYMFRPYEDIVWQFYLQNYPENHM